MTRALGAQAGIMISASHNPVEDNGIKFFGPDGFKLSDEQELEIEKYLDMEKMSCRGRSATNSAKSMIILKADKNICNF